MRKALGALAVVALVATPASARYGERVTGGCTLTTVVYDTVREEHVGVLELAAYVDDGTGNPAWAALRCVVYVGSAPVAALDAPTMPGGLAVAATPASFRRNETVNVCTTAWFADGGSVQQCDELALSLPPPVVRDLFIQAWSLPDPLLCPELAKLPGSYGPMTIDTEGDIHVASHGRVKDCPPYEPWW